MGRQLQLQSGWYTGVNCTSTRERHMCRDPKPQSKLQQRDNLLLSRSLKLLVFLLHYKTVKLWLSLFTSNFLDSLQLFTLLEDGLTSFFSLIMTTTTRATTRSLLQSLTSFRQLLLFMEESLGKVFCGVPPKGKCLMVYS